MRSEFIQKQYRNLATSYDTLQRYSDRLVRTLTVCIVDKLNLREDDRLVDLGGGTGIFTKAILDLIPLQHPVTIVDPVGEMLAQVPPGLPVERVQMGALAFSRLPGEFDKVLMKEAVHYVDSRKELFTNLHEKLTPGGVLLVVNMPALPDHLLFDAVLDRSESWYVDSQELAKLLHDTGFEVEEDSLGYEYRIPKYQYFQMLKDRYFSLLACFSDEELDEGIAEMEEKLWDQDVLHFTNRFDFLTATKR